MLISTIMLALGLAAREIEPDARPIPFEFLREPLQVNLNVGPAGRLPAAGCVGLVVTIDKDGPARTAQVFRSSRQYPVDRAVLLAIKERYRFSVPAGLDEAQHWWLFVNYDSRGRQLSVSAQCRPPPDDDSAQGP